LFSIIKAAKTDPTINDSDNVYTSDEAFNNALFIQVVSIVLVLQNLWFISNWIREFLIINRANILKRRKAPELIRKFVICLTSRPIKWKMVIGRSEGVMDEDSVNLSDSARAHEQPEPERSEVGDDAMREGIMAQSPGKPRQFTREYDTTEGLVFKENSMLELFEEMKL